MINQFRNLIWIAALCINGCGDNGNDPSSIRVIDNEWLVPNGEVFDGGPGKDGIPALTEPTMISIDQADYLSENDLVVGYKRGNDVRAYPHPILDWHEIINDKVNGHPIAIVYCPLTGTATGWERTIKGTVTTFGVSGLLYNTNVIPYDRLTDSNWSQMRLDCVNGELKSTKAETFHTVETTWSTWKKLYPQSKVVSTQTGFSRNYGVYPYGSYRTNNSSFIFPFSPRDTRLPSKERVLGVIINEKVKAFRFSTFEEGIRAVKDTFNGVDIIVIGSKPDNFIVAFESRLSDGTILNIGEETASSVTTAIVFTDTEGNQWDIFGEAVDGPRKGQRLKEVTSFIGYWFTWGSFYPGVEIFEP